jgi:hypothetical protein
VHVFQCDCDQLLVVIAGGRANTSTDHGASTLHLTKSEAVEVRSKVSSYLGSSLVGNMT